MFLKGWFFFLSFFSFLFLVNFFFKGSKIICLKGSKNIFFGRGPPTPQGAGGVGGGRGGEGGPMRGLELIM